jgi:hypothetical protein
MDDCFVSLLLFSVFVVLCTSAVFLGLGIWGCLGGVRVGVGGNGHNSAACEMNIRR